MDEKIVKDLIDRLIDLSFAEDIGCLLYTSDAADE